MKKTITQFFFAGLIFATATLQAQPATHEDPYSIARHWNEVLLSCIRLDTARPTVHARNLFHLSALMWDTWISFQDSGKRVFYHGPRQRGDQADIAASISAAAGQFLRWRFKDSANYERMLVQIEAAERAAHRRFVLTPRTGQSGTRQSETRRSSSQESAIQFGRQLAQTMLEDRLHDGANESNGYMSVRYQPLNQPFNPHHSGNRIMRDINRWQPLDLPGFVGQSGIQSENYPPFVGPEWGAVQPFALQAEQATIKIKDGKPQKVYLDQGPPPQWPQDYQEFTDTFMRVVLAAAELDPALGKRMDASPASRGNAELGSYVQRGYELNPITRKAYQPQWVNEADYYRVLAEFWADGPNSETPPGHWFVMLNIVSDQAEISGQFSKQQRLAWDLKAYLALGGAMHDAAIAAWSHKGYYDYTRPISSIRKLCEIGQRTNQNLANYHPQGLELVDGYIEVVSAVSRAAGGVHENTIAFSAEDDGKVAFRTWRGPSYVQDVKSQVAGVGWILCENWWPYQRANFVTPPFAGYVSGHSTFSRAAAEVLGLLTGSEFFPGGLGIFTFQKNKFLEFEQGPSETFSLRWASYRDAADDSALSRIYGGIHPPADDLPGRRIGAQVGKQAFAKAKSYFPATD